MNLDQSYQDFSPLAMKHDAIVRPKLVVPTGSGGFSFNGFYSVQTR